LGSQTLGRNTRESQPTLETIGPIFELGPQRFQIKLSVSNVWVDLKGVSWKSPFPEHFTRATEDLSDVIDPIVWNLLARNSINL